MQEEPPDGLTGTVTWPLVITVLYNNAGDLGERALWRAKWWQEAGASLRSRRQVMLTWSRMPVVEAEKRVCCKVWQDQLTGDRRREEARTTLRVFIPRSMVVPFAEWWEPGRELSGTKFNKVA